MKHTVSLNRNGMFQRLYSRGTSCSDKNIVIYFLPNRLSINRLGITVSKKTGCAVLRNRIKRLIRESYRLNETRIKSGYDIVIVARRHIIDADFHGISASFLKLMQKQDMLVTDNE